MLIALVYPGISYFGWGSYRPSRPTETFEEYSIPIYSLALLAGAVEEKGHKAELFDLRFFASEDKYFEALQASSCEVVGITVQTPSFGHASKAALLAKKAGKITIAGGIHATVSPEEFSSDIWDFLITGEGEISLPKLLDDIGSGRARNRIIEGETVNSLDDLPKPIYFHQYTPSYQQAYAVETSRGCVGLCTYCVSGDKRFGKKLRFRSPTDVLAEIDRAYELFHFSKLDFLDVNTSTGHRRFNELLTLIAGKYNHFEILIQERVDTFREETAQILARFRSASVAFGFETISPRLLKFIKKETSFDQTKRAVGLCRRYGLKVWANVLTGIPTQTDEEIAETYAYIKNIKPDILIFNSLSPYPGTPLHDYCKENDLLPEIKDCARYFAATVVERGFIKGVDYDRIRYWYLKFLALTRPRFLVDWTDEELKSIMAKIDAFVEIATRRNWRVGVFGAGVHTRSLLVETNLAKARPLALFDNNPAIHGKVLDRLPILNPSSIRDMAIDAIVISSRAFEEQIHDQLRRMMIPDLEIHTLYC